MVEDDLSVKVAHLQERTEALWPGAGDAAEAGFTRLRALRPATKNPEKVVMARTARRTFTGD